MPDNTLPDPVDWKQIEQVLFRLALDNISEFAAEHPDEMFYGFAFDCNADYGQAMPCLNTPEFFQLAIERKHLSPEILAGYEKTFGKPKPLDSNEQAERAKRLRWALGDWMYQDFSSPKFEEGWADIGGGIEDATLPDDELFEDEDAYEEFVKSVKESFLRMVCRVVIQLERANAFNALNRTEDFDTLVLDHDELEENGWVRLKSVREEA